ncbi:MAG: 2-oxoacid:acceptor oxidoreductase family protein [Candidatus Moranbacteria bacterium]|nr:2-oxoacid:acceptor oxidoreductase family protein [Candidatus Moranbacteria bacterium]
MKTDKKIFEIIIFARAGQGAKSAAEVLAQAALLEGKQVQAFPYYGPERNGAPTKAYVRISDDPIRTHEPILDPDVVLVLDDTLLGSEDVTSNLDEYESLIVNTNLSRKEVSEAVGGFDGNIKAVDATDIAMEVLGQNKPNGIMLGKLVQVSGVVKLDSLEQKFRDIFEAKIGEELTNKNIRAIQKGHDSF